MMYGFAGDSEADPRTLDVLEDVVEDFVSDTMTRAAAVAPKPGKLRVADLLFVIRDDAKQWGRARELLILKSEIDEARRKTQGAEVAPADLAKTLDTSTTTLMPVAGEQAGDTELHTEDEIDM